MTEYKVAETKRCSISCPRDVKEILKIVGNILDKKLAPWIRIDAHQIEWEEVCLEERKI